MKRLLQTLTLLLITCIASFATSFSIAQNGPLMNLALPSLPENQEMRVVEISLAPGQESAPHRHNAHVFVYVLEGQINMQVAGGEIVTLSAGEMFYENPDDIHAVSQNASDTEPARFLVHMLKTIGVAVTTPVN